MKAAVERIFSQIDENSGINSVLGQKEIKLIPECESKQALAQKLYEKYIEKIQAEMCKVEIGFTDKEIDFLKSLPNEKIKRLFYSLLCYEKLHPHESGWIRFDLEELTKLSGLKKVRREDFADLIPIGFQMRVVGSKNAVVTYLAICKIVHNDESPKIICKINDEYAERFLEVLNAAN